MEKSADPTRAGSSFAYWQSLSPATAARAVHQRVAGLAPALRRAAVAWIAPEAKLAAEIKEAGKARERGSTAAVHGVPIAIKDLFDLAGIPTFAGSTFLPEIRPTPTRSSRLVHRFETIGAVPAAKTHLVEFASGLTGENPHYGDCPHPGFPDRLTGGSSSGSVALVAAGVVPLALGTDTGGSVRVPASWCGLYGFRLVPNDEYIRDAFPLAPTLDTAGWFTGNAADMLATWRAFTSEGESDHPLPGCFVSLRDLIPDADPAIIAATDAAARNLCLPADDATRDGLLESWRDAVDAYLGIGMTEAFAVHREWLGPLKNRYDPVIWQRFTDAGTWSQQRVIRSHAVREQVRLNFEEFFRAYDFLVLPAVPFPAPRKSDATAELRKRVLTLTAPASLAGLPCLTIPVPLPSGLTVGLQVIVPTVGSGAIPRILAADR